MKIRADEHISPVIIKTLSDMFARDGLDLSHVADDGHRGTSDVYWATTFSRQGGNAIITADTDFIKKYPQVSCVQETGLKVIYLHPKYGTSPCHMQLALLLLWWKRIEKILSSCDKRTCWQVPWRFSENAELKKLQLNFQEATKKHKKAKKKVG